MMTASLASCQHPSRLHPQSDDDGGSTSCSCDSSSSEAGSSASEGEGSAAAGREQAVGPGSSGSSGGDQQRELEEEEERRSWLLDAAPGRPVRRQRHRAGRARGGDDGGDALGAAPERWRRRRSEVGSLLDPEPQSDTEDAELAAATGAAEAAP